MKNFNIEIIVSILVIVVIGFGVYSYRQYGAKHLPVDSTGEVVSPPRSVPQKPASTPVVPIANNLSVQATRTFSDGVHHVKGTVSLPTPCHTMDVTSRVMESYPEQVVIDIKVADAGNPCVQVIDERAWSVDVKASEKATFSVRINGQTASVDWLPV